MSFLINPYRSAAVTDPNFASTILLLSGDGTNGSTTFTDESAFARGAATVTGNAQVSTAVFKFGSGSIALDGTGDLLSFADSNNLTFSGDFTIDVWARFNAGGLATDQTLVSHWSPDSSNRSWALQWLPSLTPDALRWVTSASGGSTSIDMRYGWTPTADVWYHIRVDRSGANTRLYLDGTMGLKDTSGTAFFNGVAGLRIGAIGTGPGTSGNFFNGYIDEVRISNGHAYCGSDAGFTVPTAAYPRS